MPAGKVGETPGETKMKLPRRKLLHLAAGAAALPMISRMANARTYPARPVRIIVGFAAGQAIDILVRIIGQRLSERLGQQFIVENQPGAGGNIATEHVVRASPDGYTLLAVGSNNYINASLYARLNFNFIHDIAAVASISRTPNVLEVHPSIPVNTVLEFIAYAKAHPGKLSMASAGNGSTSHVAGELFKMMTGVSMIHVPYRGSALAFEDLLSGRVDVMFDNLPSSIEYIRTGSLRALAVTTTARSELLPDIPTVGDFVPGYEASALPGIGAPRTTPIEIIDTLNQEVNAVLADPRIKTRFADLGVAAVDGSPADFAKLIADETEKWAKVIKFAGIKPV
jgi:tripartite-type tricarboxylate transporter receptor subunit TctC